MQRFNWRPARPAGHNWDDVMATLWQQFSNDPQWDERGKRGNLTQGERRENGNLDAWCVLGLGRSLIFCQHFQWHYLREKAAWVVGKASPWGEVYIKKARRHAQVDTMRQVILIEQSEESWGKQNHIVIPITFIPLLLYKVSDNNATAYTYAWLWENTTEAVLPSSMNKVNIEDCKAHTVWNGCSGKNISGKKQGKSKSSKSSDCAATPFLSHHWKEKPYLPQVQPYHPSFRHLSLSTHLKSVWKA